MTDLVRLTHPRQSDSDRPGPGLLALHGWGADEADLLGLAPYLPDTLFVVSPRAPLRLDMGFGWYRFTPEFADNPSQMIEALALLDRFIADLPARYPIDPAQLFVLGFSQGAVMATALSVIDARRFRGAVLLSGRMPPVDKLTPVVSALDGFPVFVGHGDHDPLIPVDAAHDTRAFLAGAGAAVTFKTYPYAHQITLDTIEDINRWLAPLLPQPGQ